MFYLDTSVAIAATTFENNSQLAFDWIERQPPGLIVISDWVVTEFSAALSIKLRAGQIQPADRARAQADFDQLRDESLRTLPFSSLYFRQAAKLAEQYALGLRAGDALHLAIAKANAATLVTFDRKLLTAAAALDIPAVSP